MKNRIVALLAAVVLVLPLAVPVYGQFAAPEFEEATLEVELPENIDGTVGRGHFLANVEVTAGSEPSYSAGEVTVDTDETEGLAAGDIVVEGQAIWYRGSALDFENSDHNNGDDGAEYSVVFTASNFLGSATQTVNIQLVNVNEPPTVGSTFDDMDNTDPADDTTTRHTIAAQSAIAGGPTVDINLNDVLAAEGSQPAFLDPDDGDQANLKYAIESDAREVATASRVGSTLKIRGRSPGTAYMTLTAEDQAGVVSNPGQIIQVTVTENNAALIQTGARTDTIDGNVPGWTLFDEMVPEAGGSFQFSLPENLGKDPDPEDEDENQLDTPVLVPATMATIPDGERIATQCGELDEDTGESATPRAENCNLAWFNVSDEDANDEHRWSIVSATGEPVDFRIAENGQLMYTGEGLDYEEARALSLVLTVRDTAGSENSQGVTITVGNEVEPPQENEENMLEKQVYNEGTSATTINVADHFVFDNEVTRAGQAIYYAVTTGIGDDGEGPQMLADATNTIVDYRIFGEHPSDTILIQPIAQGTTIGKICATTTELTLTTTDDMGEVVSKMVDGTGAVVAMDGEDARQLDINAQQNFFYRECAGANSDDHQDTEMDDMVDSNDPSVIAEFDVVVGPADQFGDDNENIHQLNINKLAERGITGGCNPPDNTNYCPENPVTRGQMATFLVRAVGFSPAAESAFNDIAGTTHEEDIRALADAEITQGCNPPTNNRYCPDRAVTRGEMATFLVRAFDLAPSATTTLADIEGNSHEANIRALAAAEITRGCNAAATAYCPDREITRGEMASFLIRAMDNV